MVFSGSSWFLITMPPLVIGSRSTLNAEHQQHAFSTVTEGETFREKRFATLRYPSLRAATRSKVDGGRHPYQQQQHR